MESDVIDKNKKKGGGGAQPEHGDEQGMRRERMRPNMTDSECG